MDLTVNLAGMKLKNPLVIASGVAGYALELAGFMDFSSAGAIVLKSITVEPKRGNPAPRLWETTGGLLNTIGLENVGIEVFVKEILPSLEGLDTHFIASIAGETVREYAYLASRIMKAGAVDAVEVNVSCPNVEKGGLQFGADPEAVGAVVDAVVNNSHVPVFVKLSAAVGDISRIADAAVHGGASGLSMINTVPGMAVDPVTGRSRLGMTGGGLSGPAVKPIALKAVWDCHRATGLPIIGGGGVFSAEDVLEFLFVGARAVSIGTAVLKDPDIAGAIIDDLPEAVRKAGAGKPSELIGAFKLE